MKRYSQYGLLFRLIIVPQAKLISIYYLVMHELVITESWENKIVDYLNDKNSGYRHAIAIILGSAWLTKDFGILSVFNLERNYLLKDFKKKLLLIFNKMPLLFL